MKRQESRPAIILFLLLLCFHDATAQSDAEEATFRQSLRNTVGVMVEGRGQSLVPLEDAEPPSDFVFSPFAYAFKAWLLPGGALARIDLGAESVVLQFLPNRRSRLFYSQSHSTISQLAPAQNDSVATSRFFPLTGLDHLIVARAILDGDPSPDFHGATISYRRNGDGNLTVQIEDREHVSPNVQRVLSFEVADGIIVRSALWMHLLASGKLVPIREVEYITGGDALLDEVQSSLLSRQGDGNHKAFGVSTVTITSVTGLPPVFSMDSELEAQVAGMLEVPYNGGLSRAVPVADARSAGNAPRMAAGATTSAGTFWSLRTALMAAGLAMILFGMLLKLRRKQRGPPGRSTRLYWCSYHEDTKILFLGVSVSWWLICYGVPLRISMPTDVWPLSRFMSRFTFTSPSPMSLR